MENKKQIKDVHTVEQKQLVPQETISNSMAIMKSGFRRLWRPNNYRRQIRVKVKSDSTIERVKSAIGNVRVGNRNKLLFVPYKNILIQYGRDTLTGIYSQRIVDGEKEVFDIEASSVKIVEEEILKRKNIIRDSIDKALFSFARRFNIVKPIEKPIWSRHEDWTNDLEIEKIPDWKIIHGDHMKKVYPEGVEYVGGKDEEPAEQLINRVKNTGLKDFSPDIVEEIKNLNILYNPLRFLKSVLKDKCDVLNYPDVVRVLSTEEKFELSSFIIEKFGG